MLDLLITHARIVDGTGAPWFRGCIGVLDGRIAFVETRPESEAPAHRTINAADCFLTPGLIDCHTHLDLVLLRDCACESKLLQGVTTVVTGACGFSAAPVDIANRDLLARNLAFIAAGATPDYQWNSFGQWLDVMGALPLGPNLASHVGHGTLRTAVMGFADRAPTSKELQRMVFLLEQSLDEGARGMTSGLVYTPGIFSAPEEFDALAAVLARRGRLYETHMRNESDFVEDCVAENIALAERTGVMVQLSHLKASGRRNFGKSVPMLKALDAARARGVDIAFNQHPYAIGSTTLRAILPGWAQEGGFAALCARLTRSDTRAAIMGEVTAEISDWDNYYRNSGGAEGVILLNTPATPELEGRTLAHIAAERSVDPLELAFDLIVANKGEDAAAFDNMGQDDIARIMSHPAAVLVSDSIPGAPGAKTHPRLWGAFARILDVFVRQRGILTLEEAIRKMTSAPALRCNLAERGLLRPGCHADLALFDLANLRDNTTFANPFAAPDGVRLVVVNGVVCVENGQLLEARGGTILR